MPDKRYRVVDVKSLEPIDCPCGQARRAFLDDPDQIASLHLVHVGKETKTHFHRRQTEIYYVLEGQGQIELDGVRVDVRPGFAVLIKPECRHRLIGDLKILNIPVPAFDPEDEHLED